MWATSWWVTCHHGNANVWEKKVKFETHEVEPLKKSYLKNKKLEHENILKKAAFMWSNSISAGIKHILLVVRQFKGLWAADLSVRRGAGGEGGLAHQKRLPAWKKSQINPFITPNFSELPSFSVPSHPPYTSELGLQPGGEGGSPSQSEPPKCVLMREERPDGAQFNGAVKVNYDSFCCKSWSEYKPSVKSGSFSQKEMLHF